MIAQPLLLGVTEGVEGRTVANLAVNFQKRENLKILLSNIFLHELLINVLTHLSRQNFFRKLVIFNYILPFKVTVTPGRKPPAESDLKYFLRNNFRMFMIFVRI